MNQGFVFSTAFVARRIVIGGGIAWTIATR